MVGWVRCRCFDVCTMCDLVGVLAVVVSRSGEPSCWSFDYHSCWSMLARLKVILRHLAVLVVCAGPACEGEMTGWYMSSRSACRDVHSDRSCGCEDVHCAAAGRSGRDGSADSLE